MKFSVCVPTVRPLTLAYTVQSIVAQTWPDWELLIVGQGNDPDLARVGERVEQLDSRIRYLRLDERGISRARNALRRIATGDVLAMTDDDCEAAPDWLSMLATLFETYPQVGLIGGALLAPRVSRWKLETCISFTPEEIVYDPAKGQSFKDGLGWIGANFAVRRAVAEQNGDFDECLGAGSPYFPAAEDVDYAMRLADAGVVTLSSPAPVVYHTYGARRGVRQNLRNLQAYARGNAGLDGKLTLAGDPHGQASASRVLRRELADAIRSRQPQKLPIALLYGLTYQAAYRRCVREFVIGAGGGLAHGSGKAQPAR